MCYNRRKRRENTSPKANYTIHFHLKIMTTLNLSNLSTASLSELRTFANDNDIQIDGDRRRKASFVESIEAWMFECGYGEPADDDHEVKEFKSFTQDQPFTVELPVPSQPVALERNFTSGASLAFLLTPIVMFIAGVILSGLWLTVSFSNLVVSLARYLYPTRKLIDTGATWFYSGLVEWIQFLWGDEDEYAKSYQAVKDLMST